MRYRDSRRRSEHIKPQQSHAGAVPGVGMKRAKPEVGRMVSAAKRIPTGSVQSSPPWASGMPGRLRGAWVKGRPAGVARRDQRARCVVVSVRAVASPKSKARLIVAAFSKPGTVGVGARASAAPVVRAESDAAVVVVLVSVIAGGRHDVARRDSVGPDHTPAPAVPAIALAWSAATMNNLRFTLDLFLGPCGAALISPSVRSGSAFGVVFFPVA